MDITDTVNVMWKTLSSVSDCLVYGLKFVTVLHRALGQTQRSPRGERNKGAGATSFSHSLLFKTDTVPDTNT